MFLDGVCILWFEIHADDWARLSNYFGFRSLLGAISCKSWSSRWEASSLFKISNQFFFHLCVRFVYIHFTNDNVLGHGVSRLNNVIGIQKWVDVNTWLLSCNLTWNNKVALAIHFLHVGFLNFLVSERLQRELHVYQVICGDSVKLLRSSIEWCRFSCNLWLLEGRSRHNHFSMVWYLRESRGSCIICRNFSTGSIWVGSLEVCNRSIGCKGEQSLELELGVSSTGILHFIWNYNLKFQMRLINQWI